MTEAQEIAYTLPLPVGRVKIDDVRRFVRSYMQPDESMQIIDNITDALCRRIEHARICKIARREARQKAFSYLNAMRAVRLNRRATRNGKTCWDILQHQVDFYRELSRNAQLEAVAYGWRLP